MEYIPVLCSDVGFNTLTFGQKLSETASFIIVNEPLIIAWLAIIAAAVAIIIPGNKKPFWHYCKKRIYTFSRNSIQPSAMLPVQNNLIRRDNLYKYP